ncbi:hypothetical protein SNEBB_003035 [Seison nebaliae]|nr:hypothetical protein SNEBB_003035 [Seison nebaliae]
MKFILITLMVCLGCAFSYVIEDNDVLNDRLDPFLSRFPESIAGNGTKGRGWGRRIRRFIRHVPISVIRPAIGALTG